MTNFERIKGMNVEEMAEFLRDYDYCDVCIYDRTPCRGRSCKDGIKQWLESEAVTKESGPRKH